MMKHVSGEKAKDYSQGEVWKMHVGVFHWW